LSLTQTPRLVAPGLHPGGVRTRIALAAFGTFVGLGLLVAAEATARALWEPGRAEFEKLHEYSEVYGWTPRPGARVQEDGDVVSINRLGYRGKPVSLQPPPGTKRILLLGDSITFGTGVGDDETFAALLDARENSFETVNLAVQGYGLAQSLLKLEHQGLALSPDVVVLNVCLGNDVADTASRVFLYDGRHPQPYLEMDGGRLVLRGDHLKLSTPARLATALRSRSALLGWLGTLARPERDLAEPWAERRAALESTPGIADVVRGALQRMRALANATGARFVVVLHPDWDTFASGSRRTSGIFSGPGLDGVRLIDLNRHYKEARLKWRRLALDEVGHLSPEGHRVVADLLEGELAAAVASR
jgi:lysophospholipase L1-like esterase